MAYTGSQAGTGLGTTLSITRPGGTATLVGELKTLKQTGRQAKTDDVTNFESRASEFIPTIVTSGTWDISGNRIGGDAGQLAMEGAFNNLEMCTFNINLRPTQGQTTGDSFPFIALVESIDYDIMTEKAQSFTGKVKISGLMEMVPGA